MNRLVRYYLFFTFLALSFCLYYLKPDAILIHASKNLPYVSLFHFNFSISLFERADVGDIVCFGDSSSFFPPDLNPNPKNIDQHLAGLIRKALHNRFGDRTVTISQYAFAGANMFDYYCLSFLVRKSSPRLLIIPIRLTALAGSDVRHPELSAFVPLRTGLPPDKDPLRVHGISPVDQIQYRLFFYSFYPRGIRALMLERLRNVYDFGNRRVQTNYTHASVPETVGEEIEFDEVLQENTHPRSGSNSSRPKLPLVKLSLDDWRIQTIDDLSALVQIASQKKQKILFFTWPLNKQHFVDENVPYDSVVDESVRLLREVTDKPNIYFMDLSDLLDGGYFIDRAHFTVAGRAKVAAALVPKLMEILAEDQKE